MRQKKNLIFSLVEFLFVALVQFSIFRIVSVNLGVAELGVWSILVASIQMSKLVDPGAGAGSLKYISLSSIDGNKKSIEEYVASSLYMVVLIYLPILTFLYFFLGDIIVFFIDDVRIEESVYLIPYICMSFFLQNISLCFVGCINNMGFGYFKSASNILGMLIQLILSIMLIDEYGLLGLTISQLTNYVAVIVISLLVMLFFLKLNVVRFLLFKPRVMYKIFKVGATVQATSVAWTMFEFTLRMMMAKLGGLELSGYYEVAYRLSAQSRILSAYLMAPLTPVFVQKFKESIIDFERYYIKIYSNITFFGSVSVLIILLTSPVFSILMFEQVNLVFIFFVFTCSGGAFLHILAMVSEQCSVCLGYPKYNLLGMLCILGSSNVLGYIFGNVFGGYGVAVGVLLGISIGVSTTIYCNSIKILKVSFFPDYSFSRNELYKVFKRNKK